MHIDDRSPGVRDPWWTRVLGRLMQDMDALVEDFVGRLRATAPGYAAVSDHDLRRTARDSLTLLVGQLAGDHVAPELARLPQRLGVRRARQGVDRDVLLEAVRLDYRVLWNGLVHIVDPADAALLVRHAEDVLTTVERYISEVQSAFLDERETLQQDRRDQQVRALRRLLTEDLDEEGIEEISAQLRLRSDGTVQLAVVPADAAESARSAAQAVQHTPRAFLTWDAGDSMLFLRACPRRSSRARPREVTERIPGERDVRDSLPGEYTPDTHPLVGVRGVLMDPVHGVGAVRDAVRLAQRLAPHAPPGRLCTQSDLWIPAAAAVLAPVLPGTDPPITARLDTLAPEQRQRLVDTFLAYCALGSVRDVARAHFVHRNTVVNRLHTFRTLTGLDPSVPVQAARALLCLGEPVMREPSSPARHRQGPEDTAAG